MAEEKTLAVTAKTKQEIKRLQLSVDQITRTKSVLNSNQIQKMFNSTPQKYKYQRPGKGGANTKWTYVRASYVRRVLDAIFGFNWDLVIETSVGEAFGVAEKTGSCVVKGYVIGRVLDDKGNLTAEIRKEDFGRAEVKFTGTGAERRPLDFGNDMKAAASDLLKRCAARFGIAADVYDPEEFIEIDVIGSDEASDRQKTIADKIKKAKKAIKQQAAKVGEPNEKPETK